MPIPMPVPTSRFLSLTRLPEVMTMTGLGRTSIYHLMADGRFPASVKVGGSKTCAWVRGEIEDWIKDQIEKYRSTPSVKRPKHLEHHYSRGKRAAPTPDALPVARRSG